MGGQNAEHREFELAPAKNVTPVGARGSVNEPLAQESLFTDTDHESLPLSSTLANGQEPEFHACAIEPDSTLGRGKDCTPALGFNNENTMASSPSSADSSPSTPSPIRPVKLFKFDSPRPTRSNPIYGHVSGAQRGNESFSK